MVVGFRRQAAEAAVATTRNRPPCKSTRIHRCCDPRVRRMQVCRTPEKSRCRVIVWRLDLFRRMPSNRVRAALQARHSQHWQAVTARIDAVQGSG
jgi:hypothetical protein